MAVPVRWIDQFLSLLLKDTQINPNICSCLDCTSLFYLFYDFRPSVATKIGYGLRPLGNMICPSSEDFVAYNRLRPLGNVISRKIEHYKKPMTHRE
jgi:hypothetical protein